MSDVRDRLVEEANIIQATIDEGKGHPHVNARSVSVPDLRMWMQKLREAAAEITKLRAESSKPAHNPVEGENS